MLSPHDTSVAILGLGLLLSRCKSKFRADSVGGPAETEEPLSLE
jgi:hypothetical protein